MPSLGVNAAVIQNGKILLTKRPDFEVWCLPGGSVEAGESLAEAALRETLEETGFQVCLTGLVGIYSRNGWLEDGLHVPVFAAEIVGGELHCQAGEVLEAGFFGPDELPADMLVGHRQRSLDALQGVRGTIWMFDTEWDFPPGITRKEIYARCQASGLPPAEYYHRFVGKSGKRGAVREV